MGLQGQIHIRVASVILEEAGKITECNSTLNVMDVNFLRPPKKPRKSGLANQAIRKKVLIPR